MLKKTTLFRTTLFSLFCLLFLCAPQFTMAQWAQLNGPPGGSVGDIVSLNNALFLNPKTKERPGALLIMEYQ